MSDVDFRQCFIKYLFHRLDGAAPARMTTTLRHFASARYHAVEFVERIVDALIASARGALEESTRQFLCESLSLLCGHLTTIVQITLVSNDHHGYVSLLNSSR